MSTAAQGSPRRPPAGGFAVCANPAAHPPAGPEGLTGHSGPRSALPLATPGKGMSRRCNLAACSARSPAGLYSTATQRRGRARHRRRQPARSRPQCAPRRDRRLQAPPMASWVDRLQGPTLRAVLRQLGDGGWSPRTPRILGLFPPRRLPSATPGSAKPPAPVNDSFTDPIGRSTRPMRRSWPSCRRTSKLILDRETERRQTSHVSALPRSAADRPARSADPASALGDV